MTGPTREERDRAHAEKMQARINEIVDQAPELTDTQREDLRVLLSLGVQQAAA